MILAFSVWRGVPIARWLGVAAGLGLLLPGAYGVIGSAIVVQQRLDCDRGLIGAVGASFPEGYCRTVNWPVQFGTGAALTAVGLVGIVAIFALVRHADYFGQSCER